MLKWFRNLFNTKVDTTETHRSQYHILEEEYQKLQKDLDDNAILNYEKWIKLECDLEYLREKELFEYPREKEVTAKRSTREEKGSLLISIHMLMDFVRVSRNIVYKIKVEIENIDSRILAIEDILNQIDFNKKPLSELIMLDHGQSNPTAVTCTAAERVKRILIVEDCAAKNTEYFSETDGAFVKSRYLELLVTRLKNHVYLDEKLTKIFDEFRNRWQSLLILELSNAEQIEQLTQYQVALQDLVARLLKTIKGRSDVINFYHRRECKLINKYIDTLLSAQFWINDEQKRILEQLEIYPDIDLRIQDIGNSHA